jgi:hypothetical protein
MAQGAATVKLGTVRWEEMALQDEVRQTDQGGAPEGDLEPPDHTRAERKVRAFIGQAHAGSEF